MGALEGFGVIRTAQIGKPLTEQANDSIVRAVLRNAVHRELDVVVVGETCAMLGADLAGALRRAAAARVDNRAQ